MLNLCFTPFPVITTGRLMLRQMVKEDVHDVFTLRADASVSKYISRKPYTTVEEAEAFIAKINNGIANNEWGYWAIALRDSNVLIGTICLWRINEENRRAEIGYELLPAYQRKGIMQEALPQIINYSFKVVKLHSLEANVYPENIASIKLLEKNGFRREAYFRENFYYDGKFLDTTIYSLLNKE